MNRFSPLIVLFCFTVGLPAVFGAPSGPSSMPQQQQLPAVEKKVGPSAESVYNEGVALMKARNYASARAKFEEALKLKPNFADAHNNLAFCLRKQNPANYEKSLDHYNTAIKLNPKLARAYEYRGVLLLQMNRKADAEKDLATLKQLDSKLAAQLDAAIRTGKDTEY
jgi:tetratricopeptide (TPR) repeat protein